MKGCVKGSSALISGNLGAGIRQRVWHWKMFVMVLMIAHCRRMSIFVIFSQRNAHSIALVTFFSVLKGINVGNLIALITPEYVMVRLTVNLEMMKYRVINISVPGNCIV